MSESSLIDLPAGPPGPTRLASLARSIPIALLALGSLWLYAAATTPRVLTPLAVPLGAIALVLSLLHWRRVPRSTSATGALLLSLLVLATEAAFALLARM